MRHVSKVVAVAVVLLAVGVLSSSVRANNVVIGTFTLAHATQWKNTVLSAGDYTFKMSRTQTDTNVLSVRGSKQVLDILVFAQSACETCQSSALQVAVQGDNRVVTSLDLPGYHMNFRKPAAEREQRLAKASQSSEQVAIHIARK